MASGSILVVDDYFPILNLVALALLTEGYEVQTACDGQEALVSVQEHCPDLVVLDLQMPRMDGPSFAREVHQRGLPLKILVMTAAANARRRAADVGADGWLAKPFELDRLLSEAERLCPPEDLPEAS